MGIMHINLNIKMGILNNLHIIAMLNLIKMGNLGYVYENIVAQMLVASGHKLFYHTWRSETSNHNYEVDFLLSKGTKIRPIEVKSSGYKTHKSLDEFCRKYSGNVSDRYLLYTKDLRRDEQTLLLPVMLTMFL